MNPLEQLQAEERALLSNRDEVLVRVLWPSLGGMTLGQMIAVTGWGARETLDRLRRLMAQDRIRYAHQWSLYYARTGNGDEERAVRAVRAAARGNDSLLRGYERARGLAGTGDPFRSNPGGGVSISVRIAEATRSRRNRKAKGGRR